MNPALEMRRLYIVRSLFSSENARESTEQIDEMTEQIKLKWPAETRKAIAKVRSTYRHQITAPCLSFYGLFVIRDRDREAVSQVAEKADAEMKKINPELGARVSFITLFVEQEAVGEVYQQVLASIQGRVYTEILGRLKQLCKLPEVPKQSRTALLKFLEKISIWNVLDDPNITETLANIKLQIQNDIFTPVMQDLQKELTDLKTRGAYLEFEDEPPTAPPAPPTGAV